MCRWIVACALTLVIMNTPASAQTGLSQQSLDLIARLADEMLYAGADPVKRYFAFSAMDEDWTAGAEADEAMGLAVPVAETSLSSALRLYYQWEGVAWARTERTKLSVQFFITADLRTADIIPPTRKQLYELGDALDRLNAAGMSLSDITHDMVPAQIELLETALKLFKGGLSSAELALDEQPERDRIVRDLIDLIPDGVSPMLNGPAGAAFADVLQWNGRLWDTSTEGLDLVTQAIASGQLDEARAAEVSQRIESMAARGPWGSDTASEFLQKWAESVPGIGKFTKALWPDALPPECQPINCDCDNIDWGIGSMSDVYEHDCKASEVALKKQCSATRRISGFCHETAHGPAAFPVD